MNNRKSIEASENCACYCCENVFKAAEVAAWTDGGVTAHCPNCFIDSVLAENCGIEFTEVNLQQLHVYWFSPV